MIAIKRYIGVDVGKEGGFAMIDEEGNVEVYPMDEWMLAQTFESWAFDDCIVYIEKASVRPGQGISSSGNFMEGAGYIRGIVTANHMPFELVLASVWKRFFNIQLGKEYSYKEKKLKDIECCKRLFPDISLKKSSRSKVDSDGMADSLLLAEYCRRRCK